MKKTSIRSSLLRSLFTLIFLLSGSLLVTTVFSARSFREAVSRAITDRTLESVATDIGHFFEPVVHTLAFARHWAASGAFQPFDAESMNRLFLPILLEHPHLSSLNAGDPRGRGLMLMRLDGRWRNRFVDIDGAGPRLEFVERMDEQTALREWTVDDPGEDEIYDPRTRAWFQVIPPDVLAGDRTDDSIQWTNAYSFFTTGEPGITASTVVRSPDGDPVVVAIDVLLADLSEFTRNLEVSPNGIAFVLDETGRLLGLPGHPRFEKAEARRTALLKSPAEAGVRLLADGAWAYREGAIAPRQVFSFESGGETHWAESRAVKLGANRVFNVVAVIPEGDLLGVIVRQRQVLAGVSAVALLGAVLVAFLLSRRFSEPLQQLASNSQRIGELDLAETEPLASHLVEVDQLASEQERMRVALDAFSRYVPVEVVRKLLLRGDAARIGGSVETITILFTDIVGFTSIAESMPPPELTRHLAEYFGEMLSTIREDGHGEVSQIIGDGVLALWGAPLDDPDHARHAVDGVIRCIERLEVLNRSSEQAGAPPLPTCYGLATGPTVVGNFGAPSRLSYTAVGDSANLASRLEGLNRVYQTQALATAEVRAAAGVGYAWRTVDTVRVKGKAEAVEICELLGRAGAVTPERLAQVAVYENALAAYRRRDLAAALAGFESCDGDGPTQFLLARCRELQRAPSNADWEPVSNFKQK